MTKKVSRDVASNLVSIVIPGSHGSRTGHNHNFHSHHPGSDNLASSETLPILWLVLQVPPALSPRAGVATGLLRAAASFSNMVRTCFIDCSNVRGVAGIVSWESAPGNCASRLK